MHERMLLSEHLLVAPAYRSVRRPKVCVFEDSDGAVGAILGEVHSGTGASP